MKLSEQVITWTRDTFAAMGRDTAVLGISGGKDSAVVAAILAHAIGAENVFGVMMPNGEQRDIADSEQVIAALGINGLLVNIADQYEAAVRPALLVSPATHCPVSAVALLPAEEAKINVAPRLRMTKLYEIAQTLATHGRKACVVGTGNRAENYVGYCTKWGDMACDLNPIKGLWVHEVLQVGDELGYFPHIVHKAPDDGLSGKTDEERLGFSYDAVYQFVEGGEPLLDEVRTMIEARHRANLHKQTPIPYFTR
jgi:NAD+ synthetase